MRVLKRNKYVCILSIAVTTLLYITTKYDYHIWYVHRACPYSSGRNSYQASCIESGCYDSCESEDARHMHRVVLAKQSVSNSMDSRIR